jgi:uncharacterized membrane-anchored protein YhcB (DUF1043 family)
MEKEKLESLLIDYIDGLVTSEQRATVENILAQNEDARQMLNQLRTVMNDLESTQELNPSEQMKINFLKNLKAIEKESERKQVFFSPVIWRVAASIALVVAGVVMGYFIHRNNQRDQEMLALKKQMDDMKALMMAGLNNQQSPSQRMMGVSVAYQMSKPDDDIVNALLKTMNEDANTNVRLAALEALGKFSNEPGVRKELIEALHTQKDPMVQITLIQLMVSMKEKGVVKELEKIATDEKTMKAVKDEAYKGILKLS